MSTYGYDTPGGRAPEGPPSTPNPDGPPPPAAPAGGDPTGVIGRRTVAWVVDGLLFALIAFFFSVVGPFAKFEDIPDDMSGTEACDEISDQIDDVVCTVPPDGAPLLGEDRAYYVEGEIALLGSLASLAWFVLIYVVWQGATGATPGKALLRVRVVDATGGPPGLGRSFVRSVLWVVDGMPGIPLVGFITGLTTTGHRRVGDMVAQTYVIASSEVGRPVAVPGAEATAAPIPPGSTTAQMPLSSPMAPQGPAYGSPPGGQPGPVAAPPGPVAGDPSLAAPFGQPAGDTTRDPFAPPDPAPVPGTAPATGTPSGGGPGAPGESPGVDPRDPAGSPPAGTGPDAPSAGTPGDDPEADAVPGTGAAAPGSAGPTAEPPPGGTGPAAGDPGDARPPAPDQPAGHVGASGAEARPDAAPPGAPQPAPGAGQPQPQQPQQPAPTYQPQWDPARGAYIQWEPQRGRWLQWDDTAKHWKDIDT